MADIISEVLIILRSNQHTYGNVKNQLLYAAQSAVLEMKMFVAFLPFMPRWISPRAGSEFPFLGRFPSVLLSLYLRKFILVAWSLDLYVITGNRLFLISLELKLNWVLQNRFLVNFLFCKQVCGTCCVIKKKHIVKTPSIFKNRPSESRIRARKVPCIKKENIVFSSSCYSANSYLNRLVITVHEIHPDVSQGQGHICHKKYFYSELAKCWCLCLPL